MVAITLFGRKLIYLTQINFEIYGKTEHLSFSVTLPSFKIEF